jgi:hypothetical protein
MIKRIAAIMFGAMLTPGIAAERVQPHHHHHHHYHRHHRKKIQSVNYRKIAEAKGYMKVSSLVNFPEFFPGLGVIYVIPESLPAGPFLSFDRKDRLVATIYMIPVQDINDHKNLDLSGFADISGFPGRCDHVSFYFNSGHPGVSMPHYHFVIWHVSKKDEASVAK